MDRNALADILSAQLYDVKLFYLIFEAKIKQVLPNIPDIEDTTERPFVLFRHLKNKSETLNDFESFADDPELLETHVNGTRDFIHKCMEYSPSRDGTR